MTATLDTEVLDGIRRLAGPRGVSGFLNTAARERLARLKVLALLDDLDLRHGPPSPALRAEVARDARSIFGPARSTRRSAGPSRRLTAKRGPARG